MILLLEFRECYPPEPNKYPCVGWCCGYTPHPHDPKDPPEKISAEEQARIDQLKKKRIYSVCYFKSLHEIYDALDFELAYSIQNYKARERKGGFTFRGKTYSFAYIFDFEHEKAWLEIRDEDGNILFEEDDDSQ